MNEPTGQVQADIMLHHLHGAMDAGRAGRGVIEHLVDSLPVQTLATFNSDALIDFRSHRPWLTFENWTFTDAVLPEIRLDLVRDDLDRKILILHGPEPDLAWNEFAETVQFLVRRHGVKRLVSLMGMPAGVPHTRPTPVHMRGSQPEKLADKPALLGQMQVPAGMDQLLEYTLGKQGLETVGLMAAVPYYLAEGDYPPASAALINALAELTELALPVGDLEAASSMTLGQVSSMIEESHEAEQLVQMLEHHYDEVGVQDDKDEREEPLPTADEIGARLEEFLAHTERQARRQADQRTSGSAFNASADFSALRGTPYQRRDITSFLRRPRGRHRAEPEEDA